MTGPRRALSAALLVGLTPGVVTKVQERGPDLQQVVRERVVEAIVFARVGRFLEELVEVVLDGLHVAHETEHRGAGGGRGPHRAVHAPQEPAGFVNVQLEAERRLAEHAQHGARALLAARAAEPVRAMLGVRHRDPRQLRVLMTPPQTWEPARRR